MTSRKSLCVYCGSSEGNQPVFMHAARTLGSTLANQHIDLVYGGASIGLMGAVADSVLENGGQVIGVMPQSLAAMEIAHSGLTQLHVTETMHERKTMMTQLSDGFIALPGGLGTFEELFEIWTWAQLGFHQKPVALLNIDSFYDALLEFLDSSTNNGFIKQAHRDSLIVATNPSELIHRINAYQPTTVAKLQ